jgi:hypothetical protein
MERWWLGVLIASLTSACAVEAAAVTVYQKSLYTSLSVKRCKLLRAHPDGNAYLCPGLAGGMVYFAEGDLRAFIGAGNDPAKSRAAQQTLKTFNSPFRPPRDRATIEWRFVIKNKRPEPFAMIVRYFTAGDAGKGEVLVVTRISGAEACHIAYVDALANADAIVIARRVADDRARTANCQDPPVVEGVVGKSPM